MCVDNFVVEPKSVVGYQVLVAVLHSAMWFYSLPIIFLERRRMLPSIPTRGHGAILLLFWSLAFIAEVLSVLSWDSDDWFWNKRR